MKYLLSHKYLLIQYLIPVIYIILFYFLKVEPFDASYWRVVWLILGFYLGFILLWADGKFLYNFYNPTRTEPKQLITRSLLFIFAYLLLSIFIITSSGSMLGAGMILGIGLLLSIELIVNHGNYQLFHTKHLFQIKRQFSPMEVNWIVWGFTAWTFFLAAYFLK